MFSYGIIDELISDPRATIIMLLLALPGRLLAISAHEAAHGWMADRCGDPTARMMGRVTLNPLRHLDPVGIACMLLFGIGWARPVPVNPRNYRGNFRKCDLLVSIAGVCMNLILFLTGCIAMYIFIAAALMMTPAAADLNAADGFFRTSVEGVPVLVSGRYYYHLSDLMRYGVGLSDLMIVPVFGQTVGYIYEMLSYFVMTNLVLAIFNMIPLPPLDGYHVLNDLVLKGRLYASPKAANIGHALLWIGLFSGVLSDVLGYAYDFVLGGVGAAASVIFRLFGLM